MTNTNILGLERIIATETNFNILKSLIQTETKTYENIISKLLEAGNAGMLKGPNLNKQELRTLSQEVFQETNKILGVDNKDFPKSVYYHRFNSPKIQLPLLSIGLISGYFCIEGFLNDNLSQAGLFGIYSTIAGLSVFKSDKYKSSFNASNKDRIILEKIPRTNLIQHIAHEYTHFIQNQNGLFGEDGISNDLNLIEGHASGIEIKIGDLYSQKEDNLLFKYLASQRKMRLLTGAYSQIRKEAGEKLSEEEIKLLPSKGTLPYAIGTSFFLVQEAMHGDDVYKIDNVRKYTQL